MLELDPYLGLNITLRLGFWFKLGLSFNGQSNLGLNLGLLLGSG